MGELRLIIEPDADEPGTASVFVDGTIDGRPYRFLLDTGAARSSVMPDDYTSTLNRVGTHGSSGVFGAMSDDLVTIPRIEIGPIARQDFTLTRTTATPRMMNLIGMDLLRDYRCHFCFRDGRVLVDEANPQGDHAYEPLLVDEKFHPYVHVRFGEAQASAVWDTGASITIADLNFINSHPAYFAPDGHSTGTDSSGAQVETPIFAMSSAVIGGHVFPPHRVAAVDLSPVNAMLEIPMNLIIGYNSYSKADWLFDFPTKKWTISRWFGE